MDVYTPKSSRHHHTDGAYFGTGFPHMLFMVHPEYRPKRPANQFVPRLYGFKIHHLAYQIQQQAAANFKIYRQFKNIEQDVSIKVCTSAITYLFLIIHSKKKKKTIFVKGFI